MNGKIIVIEGLDGTGKTTQFELLKKSFSDCRFITFPNYQSHSGKIISFIATARYVSGRIKSFLNGTDASLNPKTNIHIGVVVSAKIDITFDI